MYGLANWFQYLDRLYQLSKHKCKKWSVWPTWYQKSISFFCVHSIQQLHNSVQRDFLSWSPKFKTLSVKIRYWSCSCQNFQIKTKKKNVLISSPQPSIATNGRIDQFHVKSFQALLNCPVYQKQLLLNQKKIICWLTHLIDISQEIEKVYQSKLWII